MSNAQRKLIGQTRPGRNTELITDGGFSPRPQDIRRADYVPGSPLDEFIVPLLREQIEFCMQEYGRPAIGAGTALDVGCGRQPFRGALEAMGYRYFSCDAIQNPEQSVDFVHAIDRPLSDSFLRAGNYDFMLCTEVMEHVADWDQAFENMSKLLTMGGRIIVTAPHFFPLHEEPYDFWRPTLHAIEFYSKRYGLKVLYSCAAGDAWDVLGTMIGDSDFSAKSNELKDRALAMALRMARRIVFRLLSTRTFQRHAIWHSPLYISNIAVLERLAGPTA